MSVAIPSYSCGSTLGCLFFLFSFLVLAGSSPSNGFALEIGRVCGWLKAIKLADATTFVNGCIEKLKLEAGSISVLEKKP